MSETLRYTYRLRPGAQARAALEAEWHRCRFLWNEAVHQQKTGEKPKYSGLALQLTQARSRSTWLREGSSVPQQQVLRTFSKAMSHSFSVKGRGRPKFKKRRTSRLSLEYTQRGFSLVDGALRLPRGVSVPVVWSRDLPSPPTSVRLYRDNLGHWYASFVTRREVAPMASATGGVGIDWGVKTTATASEGAYDLPRGDHRRRAAAELARAQRTMARRQRPRGQAPSAGYVAARLVAAKVHKKSQRQNTDAARGWAKRVVADHQMIAIEDLKPQFLFRSTMAKAAAEASIGSAKKTLIEYATRAGREVALVAPAFTTMTCSGCFARAKQRLELRQRTFVCWSCGLVENRDRNAARVILNRAGFNPAGAEASQPTGLSQGTRAQAEPGIPRL